MTTDHLKDLTPDQWRQIEDYKTICINLTRDQHIRDCLSQDFQTKKAPRVANAIYALIRTGAHAGEEPVGVDIAPAIAGLVLAEMLEVMADAGMTISGEFKADCVDELFNLMKPWLGELDSAACAAVAEKVEA